MTSQEEREYAGAKVLVTDGDQRSTLAVVRSLGRRGILVTVAAEQKRCLASRSKYCSQSLAYPSPYERSGEFRDWLQQQLADEAFKLLIPMTDVTCQIINADRENLGRHTKIALAASKALSEVTDKGELLNLAAELEIPFPKTYRIDDPSWAELLLKEAEYPLVIKPRRSVVCTADGWIRTSVEYCYSLNEVIRRLRNNARNLPLPLVQERVPGSGTGAFFLFDRGKKVASFFHRRLRESPPAGGASVFRESISVNQALEQQGVRLLERVKWHGVAMIEFKNDDRDGIPKLMEVNARFWGSLQLAIDAGVDFPYLLYRLETIGSIDPIDEYRIGVRSRWLIGDLNHLLIRVLKTDSYLRLPVQFPGRLATIWEFLKFVQSDMKYEIIRYHDLRPGLFEVGQFLKSIGKSFLHMLKPKRQHHHCDSKSATREADTRENRISKNS